jgi:bifunctional DNA-binding transcriptional regulator/antitoxin component of YhaV-PrlF toxin-antitoxin module
MAKRVQKRRRGYTRLSGQRQATIPLAVVREAGLRPGDELRVQADGEGRVLLERERDPLDDYAGAARGFMSQDDLRALRREWDA